MLAISLIVITLLPNSSNAQNNKTSYADLHNSFKQQKPKSKFSARQIVRNALELSAQTGFPISIDLKSLSSTDAWKVTDYIRTLSPKQQDTIVTWYQTKDSEAYIQGNISKGKILVVPVKYFFQRININSKCPFSQDLCLDLQKYSKLKISDAKILDIAQYAISVVNRGHKVVIFITNEFGGDRQRFNNTFTAMSMSPIVRDQILLLEDSPIMNSSEEKIKRALQLSGGKDTNIYGTIIIDARRTKIGEK
ncbi:hypothetical protein [Richelia sinica]|uniref:hypothetical protein n=1 Tax=Richelia sinica TaxID=1357545 RepID=UPI0016838D1F|nr:hypothetical protein [Richelia sinica]